MEQRPTRRPSAPPSQPPVAEQQPDAVLSESELIHRRAVELREYRLGRGPRPAVPDAPASRVTSAGTIAATYPVLGMTCRSCEIRIHRHVSKVPSVQRVTASAARGQVTVESSEPISPTAIERAIRQAGYEIGRTPWLERDPKVWATFAAGIGLVAILAVMASIAGIADLASGAGDLASGGLAVALLLGLAAGVSTCMALVGGLVLGLSASFTSSRSVGAGARIRPGMVFVTGRIAGYATFGAVLGVVGASVTMPPQLTAMLMLSAAVVMTILGARLTGLSPRIAGWSPTLPLGIGARLGLSSTEGTASAYSDTRAATLGALSFFLPCGFTQAIQIYALSTGSPLFAAALLGMFAIGTAPGLLGVAGLPVLVPSRHRPTLLRLVGVIVLGFAFLNGTAGLRLSGFTMPSLVGFASAAPIPGTLGADGVQRITTYQDAGGYSPGNIVVYAGYPIEWTIESSTTATCAASLFAPGVNIRARLEKGPNIFMLPALPEGVLDYTCAMGMYGARITVVARPVNADATVSPPPPAISPATAPAATQPPPAASTQELWTYQDADGYGPVDARIKAGIPTAWHVDSRSQASCAAYLYVPSLGIERVLGPGDNVIDLPALEAGTFDYACGMGMFWGSIVIEG